MRRQRGLTLLELLITLLMTAMIVVALTGSFSIGLRYLREAPARQAAQVRGIGSIETLKGLLSAATISASDDDADTFFIAAAGDVQSDAPDTLAFTCFAPLNLDVVESDGDFETNHEQFGPQGGITEVSLSLTPVGEDSNPGRQAIYLREQTPADGDPTQGGTERALIENVTSLTFEFFNGTEWVTEWDSRAGTRRLPSAVRLTFQVDGADTETVVVVPIRASDVTPDNPVTVDGGAA